MVRFRDKVTKNANKKNCTQSTGATFNDLEWRLTRFQGPDIFLKSNIVKTERLKDKVTIAQ